MSIKKFLPILVFHLDEKVFPMSIKTYVECSKLKLKDGSIISTDNFSEWVDITSDEDQVLSTLIPDHQIMTLRDKLETPVYVSVFNKGEDTFITYYFFYSQNPAPKCLLGCACPCGYHDADIEHVQVHLKDDELVKVYFSKHSGGNWVDKEKLTIEDGRPVVFVALNTHACYEKAGTFLRIGGLVPDFTGEGYKFNCAKFELINGMLMYRGDYGNGRVAGFPQKSSWLKEDMNDGWRC